MQGAFDMTDVPVECPDWQPRWCHSMLPAVSLDPLWMPTTSSVPDKITQTLYSMPYIMTSRQTYIIKQTHFTGSKKKRLQKESKPLNRPWSVRHAAAGNAGQSSCCRGYASSASFGHCTCKWSESWYAWWAGGVPASRRGPHCRPYRRPHPSAGNGAGRRLVPRSTDPFLHDTRADSNGHVKYG